VSTTLAIAVARRARRWWGIMRRAVLRGGAVAAAGAALAVFPGLPIEGARGVTAVDLPADAETQAGIRFDCAREPGALPDVRLAMRAYLARTGIPRSWVVERTHRAAVVFTLNTPPSDTATLDFSQRPGMKLRDAVVGLPAAPGGRMREVRTVSPREILLALLQHGRLTTFPCRVEALEEQVGIRQNIVAWAETLDWQWPNGGPAGWNAKYWRYGTPTRRHPLHEAVNDAFLHPARYRIGCYTATKLAVLQGVLDYYRRVHPDAARLAWLETKLAADGEPLVGVEPGAMWYFEDDFTAADDVRPGKLVALQRGVASDNFVPGDWLYLRNTDPGSRAKTGYEGSNAIYLGRNRFDDYYNDNGHHYSFREKVDEVYQWRNGVFSRSRDAARAKPLDDADFAALGSTPATGGLLEDYRAVVAFDDAADAVEFSPRAR
jgi:hypothetical protein